MNYSAGQRQPSRMNAGRNDPWISVSLLAEQTYCPRAGIIQYETAAEDTGEELFHLGRTKIPAFYDFKQMIRAIKRTFISILIISVILLVSFIFSDIFLFSVYLQEPNNTENTSNLSTITPTHITPSAPNYALLLGLLFGIVLVVCLLLLIRNILRLLYICIFLYIPAKLARASVPDPHHTEVQGVKWWSLINAGFRPIRPQDQYRDSQWHLAGCPWRILVKGDLRIPVFRKRPGRGNSGDRLFKQHYARMAAYCHLLEKCEHAQSPYGIVLFGNSHRGLTVPYQPGTKKTFHDSLVNARRTIANIPKVLPQHPANTQTCVLCPHSKRDNVTGASVCGSRFYWIPPNYKDNYLSY
jgi:hypothetical protein